MLNDTQESVIEDSVVIKKVEAEKENTSVITVAARASRVDVFMIASAPGIDQFL